MSLILNWNQRPTASDQIIVRPDEGDSAYVVPAGFYGRFHWSQSDRNIVIDGDSVFSAPVVNYTHTFTSYPFFTTSYIFTMPGEPGSIYDVRLVAECKANPQPFTSNFVLQVYCAYPNKPIFYSGSGSSEKSFNQWSDTLTSHPTLEYQFELTPLAGYENQIMGGSDIYFKINNTQYGQALDTLTIYGTSSSGVNSNPIWLNSGQEINSGVGYIELYANN